MPRAISRRAGGGPGDAMTGTYPSAQELLERPTTVERTVETRPDAPVRGPKPLPSFERVRRMPPYKQAIVWSEILGPPVALREPGGDRFI